VYSSSGLAQAGRFSHSALGRGSPPISVGAETSRNEQIVTFPPRLGPHTITAAAPGETPPGPGSHQRHRLTCALAWPKSGLETNESIGWRGALIDMVVERIDVFPGIGKPFVNVDGVTMRFDKDRVVITWRRSDSDTASAA
jgi:hypothetical protein